MFGIKKDKNYILYICYFKYFIYDFCFIFDNIVYKFIIVN